MKKILNPLLEAAVAILLFPQLFVFFYFFIPTLRGADSLSMMNPLILLGLTISRLAGPVLYILYWVITILNRDKPRGVATFLICTITGYLCVIAWNHYIFTNFSYFWSIIPVLLCSGGVGLYHTFKDKIHMAPRKPELFLATD